MMCFKFIKIKVSIKSVKNNIKNNKKKKKDSKIGKKYQFDFKIKFYAFNSFCPKSTLFLECTI